jgi:NADP-dependent 3-hydroxy acid dehydrogenase YdfG
VDVKDSVVLISGGASGLGPATAGRLRNPDEYRALVEHMVANPMLHGEVIRLDGAIRTAPR